MAETTTIEWTDATWNPVTGCSMVSAGCTNCYAMGLAGTRLRNHPSRRGLTRETGGRHVWTGEVRLNADWLDQPLRWRRPRRIFVCAHGDLFHEAVPDEWIDRVFAVMALAPQHTFQVLTKRPERMRAYLATSGPRIMGRVCDRVIEEDLPVMLEALRGSAPTDMGPVIKLHNWPLPNVWIGCTVVNQAEADRDIPKLLAVPASVRFLSAEPLLGPVDLTRIGPRDPGGWITNALRGTRWPDRDEPGAITSHTGHINLVIVGGESGPGARPMHPDWARSLRDQCQAAGVAFFFKQWGEWRPCCQLADADGDDLYHPAPFDNPDASRRCRVASACLHIDGQAIPIGEANRFHTMPAGAFAGPEPMTMFRVGKKAAGRRLDGRTWDQMPGVLS